MRSVFRCACCARVPCPRGWGGWGAGLPCSAPFPTLCFVHLCRATSAHAQVRCSAAGGRGVGSVGVTRILGQRVQAPHQCQTGSMCAASSCHVACARTHTSCTPRRALLVLAWVRPTPRPPHPLALPHHPGRLSSKPTPGLTPSCLRSTPWHTHTPLTQLPVQKSESEHRSAIYLFAEHPFDVGDWLVMEDGDVWRVDSFDLIYTVRYIAVHAAHASQDAWPVLRAGGGAGRCGASARQTSPTRCSARGAVHMTCVGALWYVPYRWCTKHVAGVGY